MQHCHVVLLCLCALLFSIHALTLSLSKSHTNNHHKHELEKGPEQQLKTLQNQPLQADDASDEIAEVVAFPRPEVVQQIEQGQGEDQEQQQQQVEDSSTSEQQTIVAAQTPQTQVKRLSEKPSAPVAKCEVAKCEKASDDMTKMLKQVFQHIDAATKAAIEKLLSKGHYSKADFEQMGLEDSQKAEGNAALAMIAEVLDTIEGTSCESVLDEGEARVLRATVTEAMQQSRDALQKAVNAVKSHDFELELKEAIIDSMRMTPVERAQEGIACQNRTKVLEEKLHREQKKEQKTESSHKENHREERNRMHTLERAIAKLKDRCNRQVEQSKLKYQQNSPVLDETQFQKVHQSLGILEGGIVHWGDVWSVLGHRMETSVTHWAKECSLAPDAH